LQLTETTHRLEQHLEAFSDTQSAIESQFAKTVRKFCSWAQDKARKHYKNDMLNGSTIVAELYWRSTLLPTIDQDEDTWDLEAELDERVSMVDFYKDPIRGRFSTLTLKKDEDPYGSFEEMGQTIAVMANHLAKVYYGLKHGLELYDAGQTEKALAIWRLGFENIWGWQLASAISAIHAIVFNALL
jgi:hypothetical protein